jgi:bifunctional ADP-heptose synthase (sugar kinase/adenylyltransferase)
MQLKLYYSATFPTIIKHRYLTCNEKREEYKKIFAINNIPENMKYEDEVYSEFKEKLKEKIGCYDAVFLCDFGHGLIDREIIDIIENNAKYLVLNCQTNSTNKGMNVITKYHRADAFSLDQAELKLAFPEYSLDEETALIKLSEHLKGNGWLTRGSKGAYEVDSGKVAGCPAFTLNVKDTIGAGDAFFATSGIFSAVGAPTEVGTFIGNIGGALGANIVGNKQSVEKVNVLKYAGTLMNV